MMNSTVQYIPLLEYFFPQCLLEDLWNSRLWQWRFPKCPHKLIHQMYLLLCHLHQIYHEYSKQLAGVLAQLQNTWKNFPNIQRIDSTTFRGIRIKQEERKSMIRNEVHLFEQSKYQTKAGPTFLRHYMSMPHQHHQLHHSLKYPPLSST